MPRQTQLYPFMLTDPVSLCLFVRFIFLILVRFVNGKKPVLFIRKDATFANMMSIIHDGLKTDVPNNTSMVQPPVMAFSDTQCCILFNKNFC